jgi:uncharacterized protein YjbI with pentapeptide repeats
MNIAKFRNSKFNNSAFINLTFNKQPRPKTDETEGYNFNPANLTFPIIENENITGYSKPFTSNFAIYNKELHMKHKIIHTNKIYSRADIFGAGFYDVKHEIVFVDFDDCVILHTKFENMDINETTSKYTLFDNVEFFGIYFENTDFEYSRFINCIFKDCRFSNVKFTKSILLNNTFYKSMYNDCVLDIIADNNIFYNNVFRFSSISIDKMTNSAFEKCNFVEVNLKNLENKYQYKHNNNFNISSNQFTNCDSYFE